jgi:FkbM family methyltransferase
MKQVIQQAVNSIGYQISKVRQPIEFPYLDVLDLIVRDYKQQVPDPFLVQIGANDGKTADPITDLIQKYHLQGVLVEPQPNIFRQLVENYRDNPQLAFENSLITAQDGTGQLYIIRETQEVELPTWCYQIASLDRQTMLRLLAEQKHNANLPEQIASLIEEVSLPALSFSSLLKKHKIDKVDILVIDTMGYDFEIIKMIPFEMVQPAIINFEHSLLSPEDQRNCFEYLKALGYGMVQISVDTIAYLNAPIRPGLYRW